MNETAPLPSDLTPEYFVSQPQPVPPLRGSKFLKVASILMIVAGGISLMGFIVTIAIGYAGYIGGGGMAASLLSAACGIAAGIIGIIKHAKASSAIFFIVTGFVVFAVCLISMIVHNSGFGFFGFAVSILYVIGGFILRSGSNTPAVSGEGQH